MYQDNRVGDARDSCDIAAFVRVVAGGDAIPCMIVEISESGARLVIAESVLLPDKFILALPLIEDHFDERYVDVRWRKAGILGVQFCTEAPATIDMGADGA